MRFIRNIVTIAAIVISLGAQAEGAKSTALVTDDAKGGDSKAKRVYFVANTNATSSLLGTAVVMLNDGKKFDGAFGLTMEDGKGVVGAVKEKTLAPFLDPKNEKSSITGVIVTDAQYEIVKNNLDVWCAKEKFGDDASRTSINFIVEVLAALKLKQPYLSGLRSANPTQFYGDVPAMNRKKIVAE